MQIIMLIILEFYGPKLCLLHNFRVGIP